jgi:hypothetical protein
MIILQQHINNLKSQEKYLVIRMVTESKLSKLPSSSRVASIFISQKWDHSFTSQPTRGLAGSLAPGNHLNGPIQMASWPSVPETPREQNSDAPVGYVSNLPRVLKLFQLFKTSHTPKYPKFSILEYSHQNNLQEKKNLPPSTLKSHIYIQKSSSINKFP